MSKLRSRLPPSFSVTVGMYATAGNSTGPLPSPPPRGGEGAFTSLLAIMRLLARAAALAPADFFAGVRKGLRTRLPADLRGFELMRGHSRLLKLHYGHPELHFEAWHHTGDGRLEVGLHFEGNAQQNERAFGFFPAHMVEVKP